MFAVLFLFQLIFLSISSRYVFNGFFLLFLKILKNKKLAIFFVWLLFLPGVVVHELSHLLFAGILLVPVHTMEFMPVLSDSGLKLGSVEIVKTDLVRRFFIGVAPVVLGLCIVVLILSYGIQDFRIEKLFVVSEVFKNFIISVFLFIVCNTMFSSRKDMEGAIGFGAVIAAGLFFLGIVQKDMMVNIIQRIGVYSIKSELFEKLCLLFAIPTVMNGVFLFCFSRLNKKKMVSE